MTKLNNTQCQGQLTLCLEYTSNIDLKVLDRPAMHQLKGLG